VSKSENVVDLLLCGIAFIKTIATQLPTFFGFKNGIPNIFPSHLPISEVLSLYSLLKTTAQVFNHHD